MFYWRFDAEGYVSQDNLKQNTCNTQYSIEDGGGKLLLSLLMVIVTAVVFTDDAVRKFICRVGDDCGEGVVNDDDIFKNETNLAYRICCI